MRENVLSLPAMAADRVSLEYLKADLHWRAEALRDLPDAPSSSADWITRPGRTGRVQRVNPARRRPANPSKSGGVTYTTRKDAPR